MRTTDHTTAVTFNSGPSNNQYVGCFTGAEKPCQSPEEERQVLLAADPKRLLESAIILILDPPKTAKDKAFQSQVIRHLKGILKAREDWISQTTHPR